MLITALGVSAAGGVIAGQRTRNVSATQTTAVDIDVQFALGVTDLESGEYQLAAQRLRWVLERMPDYPGAAERLAEAEQRLAGETIDIPTLAPSTSQDPEILFSEAQGYYEREEWAHAISRLQEIQSLDARFREVEIQEMLYGSLATLGLTYIRGERIEEGLYLLEQAEHIRPLDDQTAGERYLATLYSTGQTYWGLNWNVVIQNFEAIAEIAPDYRGISERLWEAYIRFAEQLAASGAQCDAAAEYEHALALRDDDVIREKQEAAADACAHPPPLPTATPLDFGGTTEPQDNENDNSDGSATATPSYNIP